jgi:hypothetical protein
VRIAVVALSLAVLAASGCTRPLRDATRDAGVVETIDGGSSEADAATAEDGSTFDAGPGDGGVETPTDASPRDGGPDAPVAPIDVGPRDASDARTDAFVCQPGEGLCRNDIDEDCDGLTDCEDDECASRPACDPTCGGSPC